MPSKSLKQAKLMAACSHGADYESCPPKKVAKDFNKADKETGILKSESKIISFKEFVTESKSAPTLYHPTYTSAVGTAREHLEKKEMHISDDDWFDHVNTGSRKPREGETTHLHIPLHDEKGNKLKKQAHIQVYNRGNEIPNNHELNVYAN